MPLVLIEAFACGTPAIVTSIHGPMEMIKDGFNGYVATPKNPMDIANKVKKNHFRQKFVNEDAD